MRDYPEVRMFPFWCELINERKILENEKRSYCGIYLPYHLHDALMQKALLERVAKAKMFRHLTLEGSKFYTYPKVTTYADEETLFIYTVELRRVRKNRVQYVHIVLYAGKDGEAKLKAISRPAVAIAFDTVWMNKPSNWYYSIE